MIVLFLSQNECAPLVLLPEKGSVTLNSLRASKLRKNAEQIERCEPPWLPRSLGIEACVSRGLVSLLAMVEEGHVCLVELAIRHHAQRACSMSTNGCLTTCSYKPSLRGGADDNIVIKIVMLAWGFAAKVARTCSSITSLPLPLPISTTLRSVPWVICNYIRVIA